MGRASSSFFYNVVQFIMLRSMRYCSPLRNQQRGSTALCFTSFFRANIFFQKVCGLQAGIQEEEVFRGFYPLRIKVFPSTILIVKKSFCSKCSVGKYFPTFWCNTFSPFSIQYLVTYRDRLKIFFSNYLLRFKFNSAKFTIR